MLAYRLLVIIASLGFYSYGEEFGLFIEKHRLEIQEQIMIGSEGTVKNCDILNLSPRHSYHFDMVPQWEIELQLVNSLDLKRLMSTSSCLLISSHVNDFITLSALLKFGWLVIQHRRLGMLLNMGPGMTIQALRGRPNPFMIAARTEHGNEEFLCPVLGQGVPLIQTNMCDRSFNRYEGKILDIGCKGNWPYFFESSSSNQMSGVFVSMMNFLKDKLDFKINKDLLYQNMTYSNLIRKVKLRKSDLLMM